MTRSTPEWFRSIGSKILCAALLGALTTCSQDAIERTPTGPHLRPPASEATTPISGDVLVGAGNIARCDRPNDEATAAILDTVAGTVFTTGDNIFASGSTTDFTSCYDPTWGRHRARTRPAAGDREYLTAGASGYFSYFGAPAGDAAQGYYSYDLTDWHVIVLNSGSSAISTKLGSPQEQWLRADLAANTKRCVLAYWHHPLFSSSGTAVNASIKPLWDDLYAAHTEIVLNGHYQVYERFAPQTPTEVADPENGIRQFTVGTGGAGVQAFSATIRPNSEVRSSGTYGVLQLTLGAGAYGWQFLPAAGQTFTDSGSGACHNRAGVAAVTVDPASADVPVGQTVQLTATLRDTAGNPLSGRTVTWQSSDGGVASVSTSGLVLGLAEGAATITATSEGQSGSSAITVTAPPPGSPVVLVGAGDMGDCANTRDEATAALLDAIPGTVFALGDNAYPDGSATEYSQCYGPSWGRHKTRTRPAPGNHDYNTAGAAGYFGYFGALAGDAGKGYYTYDLGDWQIISLNSSIAMSVGSAQEQWLRGVLAASTKRCTVAYWHHPRFTPEAVPLKRSLFGNGVP
ncbi:MAG TPA: Ig-like domain-containing protein [Gemmatimonadales bacterium]|nr:Ig-like domain-containing protein [Gemmatimonadales bacterium]